MGGCFKKPQPIHYNNIKRNTRTVSKCKNTSLPVNIKYTQTYIPTSYSHFQLQQTLNATNNNSNINKMIKNYPDQPDFPASIKLVFDSTPLHIQEDEIISQQKSCVVKTDISINPMQVDLQKPYGIKNLPPQWQQQLGNSNILPSQVLSNPQAMIEIISTFDQIFCQSVISKKVLTTRQFQKIIQKVQFIQGNPSINFCFEKQIGEGGACKVFFATDRENQNKSYAVRVIKINDIYSLRKIKNQIAVMHICQNQNTLKHHFSYYFRQSLFMFIQHMNFGSLTNLVTRCKKLPQDIIAYIIKQILKGLKIIHNKSQIHRDLKSDNILLSLEGNVKIGDFGYALQLTKQKLNPIDVVGTPAWMAPQLIKKQFYNESVDIWALGIILIEMYEGQPPNLRVNKLKAMYNVVSQPAPSIQGCSLNMKTFLQCCLKKKFEERSNVNNLLKHPFISSIANEEIIKNNLLKLLLKYKK